MGENFTDLISAECGRKDWIMRPPRISYKVHAPPSGEASCPVERRRPEGSILQEATGGANPPYCTTLTQPRALKSQNRTVLSPGISKRHIV